MLGVDHACCFSYCSGDVAEHRHVLQDLGFAWAPELYFMVFPPAGFYFGDGNQMDRKFRPKGKG